MHQDVIFRLWLNILLHVNMSQNTLQPLLVICLHPASSGPSFFASRAFFPVLNPCQPLARCLAVQDFEMMRDSGPTYKNGL